MEENLVVIRDPKTFCFNFDWPKDENMKYKIEFIIKSNESLAENKIKNETEQLLLKYEMEAIFKNTENSKENTLRQFVFNLSQRLDLRSLNKHVTL